MEIPNVNEAIKVVTDRMKVPIVLIYVIVSILYNWDKILLIMFHDETMLWKINYIKFGMPPLCYLGGAIICLVISIVLLFLFAFLNTWCTSTLLGLYKRDKFNKDEIDSFKLIEKYKKDLELKDLDITKCESEYNKLSSEYNKLSSEYEKVKEFHDLHTITLTDVVKKHYSEILESIKDNYELAYVNKKFLDVVKEKISNNELEFEKDDHTRKSNYPESTESILSLYERNHFLKRSDDYTKVNLIISKPLIELIESLENPSK